MRPYLLTPSSPEEKPSKPSTFEVATRLVLPVALVVVAQLQTQRSRFWGALGLAGLTFLIGFFSPAVHGIRRIYRRWRDRRAARPLAPEFRRFLERFSEFVESDRNDSLEHVVRERVCRDSQVKLGSVLPVRAHLFAESLYYARERLRDKSVRVSDLTVSFEEFNTLIANYLRYCVEPVFDDLPENIKASLTATARRDLESFRERFVRFLDDYGEYLTQAARSFSTTSLRPHYFQRPKSLSAEK